MKNFWLFVIKSSKFVLCWLLAGGQIYGFNELAWRPEHTSDLEGVLAFILSKLIGFWLLRASFFFTYPKHLRESQKIKFWSLKQPFNCPQTYGMLLGVWYGLQKTVVLLNN